MSRARFGAPSVMPREGVSPPRPISWLPAGVYETSFGGGDEAVISQGGIWLNGQLDGVDWSNCGITNGRMHSRMTAPGTEFRDATAVLRGSWSKNHEIITTVDFDFPEAEGGDPNNIEIEHRLRTVLTAGVNSGYEVGYRCGTTASSYRFITIWHGPLGSFDIVVIDEGDENFGIDPGDVIRSTIEDVGPNTVVRSFKNDILTMEFVESIRFPTGAPGAGFFHHPEIPGEENRYLEFGITHFLARNL